MVLWIRINKWECHEKMASRFLSPIPMAVLAMLCPHRRWFKCENALSNNQYFDSQRHNWYRNLFWNCIDSWPNEWHEQSIWTLTFMVSISENCQRFTKFQHCIAPRYWLPHSNQYFGKIPFSSVSPVFFFAFFAHFVNSDSNEKLSSTTHKLLIVFHINKANTTK